MVWLVFRPLACLLRFSGAWPRVMTPPSFPQTPAVLPVRRLFPANHTYLRTAPVVPASARSSKGGVVSRKAEVRARRFGARDKTQKMLSLPMEGATKAAGASGRSGMGTIDSGRDDGDESSAAQSLEALTRRAEVVAEDLERTEGGLVELEAEEAEVAGEAEAEVRAADPLDVFMFSNRQNEREQAMLRLTAQRDSLRAEQARLKAMVEAARPSMPSLKPALAAVGVAKDRTELDLPGSALSSLQQDKAAEVPAVAAAKTGQDGDTADAGVSKSAEETTGGDGESTAGEAPGDGLEERPKPSLAPATAPAALPGSSAVVTGRKLPAAPHSGAGRRGGNGGVDKEGEMESSQTEVKSSGLKRTGTPVGAAMPPPPPAKRPQIREETSALSADKGTGSAKRGVKGPASMPPALGTPSANVDTPTSSGRAGAAGGSKAGRTPDTIRENEGGVGKIAGKGVLEGGDADWVPPKGQAGDGRTALNAKFGY